MEENTKMQVSSVTNNILGKINHLINSSSGKALLAKLRNSAGKPFCETVEVWPILFENLPEEYLGNNGQGSDEEIVILSVLQLYAIHQQGSEKSVLFRDESSYKNIGYSLKALRNEGSNSIDARFNAMITSNTFEELTYHLRHLIKVLKAKSPETGVDYAKLAQDFFWFKKGYQESVRLAWAREYYRKNYKGDVTNEN